MRLAGGVVIQRLLMTSATKTHHQRYKQPRAEETSSCFTSSLMDVLQLINVHLSRFISASNTDHQQQLQGPPEEHMSLPGVFRHELTQC